MRACSCSGVKGERFDFARGGVLGAVVREPRLEAPVRRLDGALLVEAVAMVAGVYTYPRVDGGTQAELRDAGALFAREALASLKGKPVTRSHPGEGEPGGFRLFRSDTDQAIGHVLGARADGDALVVQMAITDPAAAAAVEQDELVEVSPGYRLALEPSPGVHRGHAYDARTVGIDFDHVAIGPAGWGRCGATCSIRSDAHLSLLTDEQLAERIRSARLNQLSPHARPGRREGT